MTTEETNHDGAASLSTAGFGVETRDSELREVATLAYRALEDAHRVLSTIDGDDTHEQHELSLLAKRVQDVAVSLFTVLRNPAKETPNRWRNRQRRRQVTTEYGGISAVRVDANVRGDNGTQTEN